jgi:soluble lytic murein transglycosylase-like protein
MLKETHTKILKKANRRSRIIQGVLIFLLISSIGYQWLGKIGNDLIWESYQLVKYRLVDRQARYVLLQILRNKPLTVGQALEIADVALDQTKQSNVPIRIVLGLMDLESEFMPEAVSSEGARGLLMFIPSTWQLYVPQKELQRQSAMHNPALNVRMGIRYLGDLMKEYHGDWKKVLKEFGGFVKNDPGPYIRIVMANAEKYKAQLGE